MKKINKRFTASEINSIIFNENGINEYEQKFCDLYFESGQQGTVAYISLYPDSNATRARLSSDKLLNRPRVKKYIEKVLYEKNKDEEIELGYLIKKLKKVIEDIESTTERDENGKITNRPDYGNLIKAATELAKLGGFNNPSNQNNILVQSTGEVQISFGDWSPKDKPRKDLKIGDRRLKKNKLKLIELQQSSPPDEIVPDSEIE